MRGPAGRNEGDKSPENPAEIDVRPLGDEHRQHQRNGKISQRNDAVGQDVEPDQAGLPKQANAVRRQLRGIEEMDQIIQPAWHE
jgi:hypothetical protein